MKKIFALLILFAIGLTSLAGCVIYDRDYYHGRYYGDYYYRHDYPYNR